MRAHKMKMRIIVFLSVLLLLGSFGFLVIYPNQENEGRGQTIQLNLEGVSDYGQVAQLLSEKGVIGSPFLWKWFATVTNPSPVFRQGIVLLTDQLTPRQVLVRVVQGLGPVDVRVTIPEGFNLFDIGARLENKGVCDASEFREVTQDQKFLMEHDIQGDSAEGFLFPDTYWFREKSSCSKVAAEMVQTWKRKAGAVFQEDQSGLQQIQKKLHWGITEVMTLASIVEKEAVVAKERPIIAGVFVNRLTSDTFKPKLLQADPTVAYGCLVLGQQAVSCVGFEGSITISMLRDKTNTYNTYKNEGLPPGPISNPGIASIRAVLAYAKHNYYYFVVKEKGHHKFSETLKDHQEAVKEFREASTDEGIP